MFEYAFDQQKMVRNKIAEQIQFRPSSPEIFREEGLNDIRCLYLNGVIAGMTYYKKETREQLLNLLPHKWKLQYPESILRNSIQIQLELNIYVKE